MAEQSVQKDIKLTKAEREKEQQAEARRQLYYSYPLPENISEMKSFAFGQFTWRDMIAMCGSILVCLLLFGMPLTLFLPQWIAILIGAGIGIIPAFFSIKHIFTGDLPIEERLKIAISERGELNLLHWDKTKKPNGHYVETSTQSFVPQLVFTDDNYTMLPFNQGGIAIIELAVDDMTQAKDTDLLGVVNSFKRALDALIQDTDCTPIQIMLKSIPKNLKAYIDSAQQRSNEIYMQEKYVQAERAMDYYRLLSYMDGEKAFYYKYYIVVTYREDAEHVAEDTMNTASVKRKKLREKGLNPIAKRAKDAKDANFTIGMSEEERKAQLREAAKEAEFGPKRTKNALERRVGMVVNMLRDMGSTHTAVKPRLLDKSEIAKLIFECYNSEDKNIVDSVLNGALEEKTTIYSAQMYRDFPNLFPKPKRNNGLNATQKAQRAGALKSADR